MPTARLSLIDASGPPVALHALPSARSRQPERARAGDRRLYQEHADAIFRFLCDSLRNRADATDALQETFARAFNDRGALGDRRHMRGWLLGIARNVCLEQYRLRRRIDRIKVATDEIRHAGAGPATPEGMLLGHEACRAASSALDQMSEPRRCALLLRIDHGLSYGEIARVLGCTVAKSKVLVHRARLELRAALLEVEP